MCPGSLSAVSSSTSVDDRGRDSFPSDRARTAMGRGITSELLCGWASPEGIELARRHGAEPEIWGDGGNLQWTPAPGFAAWLAPRLAAADLVHAHMFGAWWAAALAAPAATPLVASEHNQYLWPD